jgi:hypothetical protein
MLTRVAVAISVFCLILPASTFAEGFAQGDKEIQLNGSGVSSHNFDSTIFSLQGSIGYFLTPNIEGSFRQSLGVSSIENGTSSWNGVSRVAGDYHLDLGRFWPFAGANFGYAYGHHVADGWEAGIEGGLKFFVNNTTFFIGMIEYDWFLTGNGNNGFDNGQFVYVLGIGFKF